MIIGLWEEMGERKSSKSSDKSKTWVWDSETTNMLNQFCNLDLGNIWINWHNQEDPNWSSQSQDVIVFRWAAEFSGRPSDILEWDNSARPRKVGRGFRLRMCRRILSSCCLRLYSLKLKSLAIVSQKDAYKRKHLALSNQLIDHRAVHSALRPSGRNWVNTWLQRCTEDNSLPEVLHLLDSVDWFKHHL